MGNPSGANRPDSRKHLDLIMVMRWGTPITSFSKDFHEDMFSTPTVKFALENLFSRTKIELGIDYRDDDFTAMTCSLRYGWLIKVRPLRVVVVW